MGRAQYTPAIATPPNWQSDELARWCESGFFLLSVHACMHLASYSQFILRIQPMLLYVVPIAFLMAMIYKMQLCKGATVQPVQRCNGATVQPVQRCNGATRATVQPCNPCNGATVQRCNPCNGATRATVQRCNGATVQPVQRCNRAAVQRCNGATVQRAVTMVLCGMHMQALSSPANSCMHAWACKC